MEGDTFVALTWWNLAYRPSSIIRTVRIGVEVVINHAALEEAEIHLIDV
ncbi:unnamed protein product, partial [marine sediment metagenome]